jgi:hypothetical protein
LHTASGRLVSADAPPDHPWHHGLWSTIKFVNGTNFWEEYGEFGTLATVDVQGDRRHTIAAIDWVAPGGEVAVRETRTLQHVELGAGAYAIDWTVALVPAIDTEFDRTPYTTWGGYGGLTLRGPPDWTGTALRLPDRPDGDKARGERAWWCALASDDATVAILDHPSNPRAPTSWYGSTRAETYGEGWANFLNAAFLWDGPLRVPAGTSFEQRHRVIVADGAASTAWLSAGWDAWAGSVPV